MSKPSWFDVRITMGNVLTMIVMVGGLLSGYITLSNTVASSAEAVRVIPAIENRVSTIETRINLGQQAREAFQSKTEAQLDRLASQNALIMAQLAGIVARMDEAEKRR